MNIKLIKQLCSENRLRWTNHAFVRLMQRKISIQEIQESIMSGEIIEVYPDDRPYPSYLLLGVCINKQILHIVCSINDDDRELWIITAYEPSPEKWSEDFRKRKEIKKMKCLMCKGDLQNKTTNFIADLENCIVIVKNVPSQVCAQCGEVSYSHEVAIQLEKIVNSMRTSAMEVAIVQYDKAA